MRISNLVFSWCAVIAIAGRAAAASDEPVASFLHTAQMLMKQGGSPALFVGRIAGVAPGRLPCGIPSGQSITYSVKTVLFGFVPPDRVTVTYPKCDPLGARFSSQGDALVLTVISRKDFWVSEKELMLPAAAANLQQAQTFLNADLKNRISQYMRDHGPPRHNNRVVVFEGIVRDPVPHMQEPIVCTVQPIFPVNYDVEQVLRGDWTDKKMVVHFGACFNLPDPPIRVGQRTIVFAFVSDWQSQVYGDLNLLIAPEQMAQVKAALGLH
jgi:hypothetical protein